MKSRILLVLAIWFLIDLFAFQAITTATNISFIHNAYWLFDVALLVLMIYFGAKGNFASGPNKKMNWLMALVMLSIIPKLFISLFLIGEDVFRFIYSFFDTTEKESFLVARNVFYNRAILLLTLIPFFGIVYGVIKGKYAYKVQNVKLKFKNLPDAFHGFKITQLSDIHSGSFDNKKAVEKIKSQLPTRVSNNPKI